MKELYNTKKEFNRRKRELIEKGYTPSIPIRNHLRFWKCGSEEIILYKGWLTKYPVIKEEHS